MPAKEVLGIVASYRKVGNCEIAVKAVAERMGDGWELSLVRLPKLEVLPCKGCYVCLLPGMGCNLEDDMEWLLRQIEEADAVVFAAPNYTLGPVGMVKMLSDRALQAVKYSATFRKKPTAVILTLGKEDYRGYSDTALNSQVRTLGLNVVALEHFYCTHPGEIAMADDFVQRVQGLANRLTAGTPAGNVSPDRCPRCFSDLFRVRPEGLECGVCKAQARFENGSLNFFYYHPMFTDEGRKEHFEWLLMKKAEYSSIKDRLREIQDSYREGVWVSPEAAVSPAAASAG